MSQEIAVVGSPEFTTGFRLAGVRRFETVSDDRKAAELTEAVSRVLDAEDVGIVVMNDADLAHLSRDVRNEVQTSVEPTVVTLGGGSAGLREQIKRAIGIDLMGEQEAGEGE